ncbi:MAG: hypothetical protein DVB23_002469 [Verrucomicrobia bacterium]|jgi:hypothetical protein|nr:MAG: hypothetical protein DVB23_002469 [Verrucomicrobiota bacterium]
MKIPIHLASVLFLVPGFLPAQEPARREISTNFAPAEVIKSTVQAALSPEGRFVILPEKGSVLVIDQPERIEAAERAIQALHLPDPVLELHVGVRTGGIVPAVAPPAQDPFSGGRDFPVPLEFAPPRVILQPNGQYLVIPATPTRFGRRSVGTTLESNAVANQDGSVQVNLRFEDVQFAGFVPYGSPVLPFGTASLVPLQGRIPRPLAMGDLLRNTVPELPIFETTRISTSIVVAPSRTSGTVQLDLMPQVTISGENGVPDRSHAFREYRTKLALENGEVATVRGFRNAPEAFNEAFFGDEKHPTGKTELVLKGRIVPASKSPVAPQP